MTTDRQAHLSSRSVPRRAWVVAEATGFALVTWAIASLAGVGLTVQSGGPPQQVSAAAVAMVSLVAGLAGWAAVALLERRVSRPYRIWTVTASGVLLLSLVGPLGTGTGVATTMTLLTLHLGVGAILITRLPRRR